MSYYELDLVHDSSNHLDSLLKSGNQVEILESDIILPTFILGYFVFSRYSMDHVIHKPIFGKKESQELMFRIKPRF